MSEEIKNFILFVILSIAIVLGWEHFFGQKKDSPINTVSTHVIERAAEANKSETTHEVHDMENSVDISIKSNRLSGTMSSKGGVINNMMLLDYKKSLDENSDNIQLLKSGDGGTYSVEMGLQSEKGKIKLPNGNTIWKVCGNTELTPEKSVKLTWDNGDGIVFEKIYTMDENFMMHLTQRISNNTEEIAHIKPYMRIIRSCSERASSWSFYEGPIGVFNGKLEEVSYDDVDEKKSIAYESKGGWAGITDKYWLVSFIPEQNQHVEVKYNKVGNLYTVDMYNEALSINPGTTIEVNHNLFIGAKEIKTLDAYEKKIGVSNFDLAIDFGYLYFLTKPLLYVLVYTKDLIGNLGWAILLLTVLLKLFLFPLSNKSYKSMNKMREMQPKIKSIQERHANDKVKLGQELSNLYKKEKISPAGGCLPTLLQSPILFALYKVLYVCIDMRHAPFIGWIRDLSVPDQAYVLNLFGMIPINLPSFLQIGVLPILMGFSMWLQQKMSPQVGDQMQAKMMMIMMPLMFTFMFSSLPSGLVMYWTWSSILGIVQQYVIMKLDEKSKKVAKK